MTIKQLSPQLANQIAAGEVIDRPAAVIKELLENALDAGATEIEIDYTGGGTQCILVRDNGTGIDSEELPLALLRHATSKILTIDDLSSIKTLGFRGEALAAIASVAKVRIASRTPIAEYGATVLSEGGQSQPVAPCAHPQGTTIEVKALFYNTPARRRFLRSEKTEGLYIDEGIKRILLSRFDVAFTLSHFTSPKRYPIASNAQAQLSRIGRILGKKFIQHSVNIDIKRLGLRLWGWIANDNVTHKQGDHRYFYINRRVIRDRVIMHAIKSAYQNENPSLEGGQPNYVLFLEVDPAQLDVNVHPTKLEVRFSETRLVHDFICFGIKEALAQQSNFVQDKLDLSFSEAGHSIDIPQEEALPYPHTLKSSPLKMKRPLIDNEQTPLQVNQSISAQCETTSITPRPNSNFYLYETSSTLYIIDLIRAFKPVMCAIIEQYWAEGEPIEKPLLFPIEMHLTPYQIKSLPALRPSLSQLGLQVQLRDSKLFFLTAPIGVDKTKLPQFVNYLFEKTTLTFKEALDILLNMAPQPLNLSLLHRYLASIESIDTSEFAYSIPQATLTEFFSNRSTLVE